MDKEFHLTLYWAYDYLSMLGLKLNHINESGPQFSFSNVWIYFISIPMYGVNGFWIPSVDIYRYNYEGF